MRARHVNQRRDSDTNVRHTLKIVDIPSEPGTQLAAERRRHLLREVAADDRLLMCGPADFEKFRMYHSGHEWVIECEADVEDHLQS